MDTTVKPLRRLTDTELRSLLAKRRDSRFELPDGTVEGLMARIGRKGAIMWTLRYRVVGEGGINANGMAMLGRRKRLTLGRYPIVGVKEARAKARQVLLLASQGTDPVEDERRLNGAVTTVADLIDKFVDEYVLPNLKDGINVERILNVHVRSRWENRRVDEVSLQDGAILLREVMKKDRTTRRGGPAAAAHVYKNAKRMFRWAVEQGLIEVNPLLALQNPVRLRARDRVLSMDELRVIWKAAGNLSYPWGPLYRLLMLTGARRCEWAEARWSWVSIPPDGSDNGFVEVPANFYKTGKPHALPLASKTRAIVEQIPRWNGGDFLLSTTTGLKPICGFSKSRRMLDKKITELAGEGATVPDHWTVHDLRRSAATHMARLGVDDIVIEMVLGHVLPGIKGLYNRYRYYPEKRDALEIWEKELLA